MSQIKQFMHCRKCIEEMPSDTSPQEWARGCRVVRVRIENAIEEEHSVSEFLANANDLETP